MPSFLSYLTSISWILGELRCDLNPVISTTSGDCRITGAAYRDGIATFEHCWDEGRRSCDSKECCKEGGSKHLEI